MPSRLLAVAAAGVVCLGLLVPAAPATAAPAAPAAPAAKHYKNCAAVHADFSGGIAKPGITTNLLTRSGKKVRVPLNGVVKHSKALYDRNKGLDRDKDGVACET